jgi:hypothetical protein
LSLLELSWEQAFAQLVRTNPDYRVDVAYSGTFSDPFCLPDFQPSFTISTDDKVFTAGSCFARNIEDLLLATGHDLPVRRALKQDRLGAEFLSGMGTLIALNRPPPVTSPPPDLSGNPRLEGIPCLGHTRCCAREGMECPVILDVDGAPRIDPQELNQYVPHSILQELRWALDERTPWPQDSLVQVDEDDWIDPIVTHQYYYRAPRDLLLARRAKIDAAMRKISECGVIILTLGLVEAWYDRQTGLYLNSKASREMNRCHPGRFVFRTLEYEEIVAALEQTHELLTTHLGTSFNMILTVSPVSLRATYRGIDPRVANVYSKSVLRAAAEKFCASHENVDYYPSFETVTLSSRPMAYAGDDIHAQSGMVWINVARMLARYAPGVALNWDEQGVRNVNASYLRFIKSSLDIAYGGKRHAEAGGMIEADIADLVQERDALRDDLKQKVEANSRLVRERQDDAEIISGLRRRVAHLESPFGHKLTKMLRLSR